MMYLTRDGRFYYKDPNKKNTIVGGYVFNGTEWWLVIAWEVQEYILIDQGVHNMTIDLHGNFQYTFCDNEFGMVFFIEPFEFCSEVFIIDSIIEEQLCS